MTTYKDVLKVEFKDAISHFKRSRNIYHIYRINRLMSNGTLINFDFYFLPSEDPNIVTQEINLQEFGKLTFEIDVGSSYGQLITEDYVSVIDNFLDKYSVDSVYLGKN